MRRTEQLAKFCEDYSRLDATLSTLADQTSHPLMVHTLHPAQRLGKCSRSSPLDDPFHLVRRPQVPLGPLAFMPGRAVHTNEVFVLLGENYFVERSTKQAREIIDRRLTGTRHTHTTHTHHTQPVPHACRVVSRLRTQCSRRRSRP